MRPRPRTPRSWVTWYLGEVDLRRRALFPNRYLDSKEASQITAAIDLSAQVCIFPPASPRHLPCTSHAPPMHLLCTSHAPPRSTRTRRRSGAPPTRVACPTSHQRGRRATRCSASTWARRMAGRRPGADSRRATRWRISSTTCAASPGRAVTPPRVAPRSDTAFLTWQVHSPPGCNHICNHICNHMAGALSAGLPRGELLAVQHHAEPRQGGGRRGRAAGPESAGV